MRNSSTFRLLLIVLLTGILTIGCKTTTRGLDSGAPKTQVLLGAELQKTLDTSAQGVVGVSAAVIIPDQGMWQGTTGWSNKKRNQPVTSDLIFELGSLTKNFTAAAILQFVEGCGKRKPKTVCLDDPLIDYLPQYAEHEAVATNGSTVRQALNMTSGIYSFTSNSDYWNDVAANYGGFWTPQYIIETYLKKPNFKPGTDYEYSNTNFVLAGIVLQSLLNSYDLSPHFRSVFFEKHNLDETFFGGYEVVQGPTADGWQAYLGSKNLLNMTGLPRTASLTSSWTAGAFLSTAEDMALWIDALYHHKTVLPQNLLDDMLTFVPVELGNGTWWDGYGLGTMRMHVKTDRGNLELYGYGGNTDAFTSYSFYLPSYGVTLTFLINEGSANDERVSIAEAMVRTLVKHLPAGSLSPTPETLPNLGKSQ